MERFQRGRQDVSEAAALGEENSASPLEKGVVRLDWEKRLKELLEEEARLTLEGATVEDLRKLQEKCGELFMYVEQHEGPEAAYLVHQLAERVFMWRMSLGDVDTSWMEEGESEGGQ